MKPTEEQIKQVILEETRNYLKEIEGRLGAKKFQLVLQKLAAAGRGAYEKGHVPFTDPHREAWRQSMAESSVWEVLIMVMGDPGGRAPAHKDWPNIPEDRNTVKEFLTQLHGYSEEEVFDQEGNPLIPWSEVQKLAMGEMEKYKQQQQMKEIIKEEIIKFLKENE